MDWNKIWKGNTPKERQETINAAAKALAASKQGK